MFPNLFYLRESSTNYGIDRLGSRVYLSHSQISCGLYQPTQLMRYYKTSKNYQKIRRQTISLQKSHLQLAYESPTERCAGCEGLSAHLVRLHADSELLYCKECVATSISYEVDGDADGFARYLVERSKVVEAHEANMKRLYGHLV
jgi:hypothetical protein